MLSFTFVSNAQSWEFLEYDSLKIGLELNPLKGFATLFNPNADSEFPQSIRGRLFGLDTLMSGPNTFDWSAIDNFLDEQSALGIHAYIQVNVDPAFGETHLPDYLLPLVDTYYYDDPALVDPVDDLCPDWDDPDLMNAMLTFIDSFGLRYDNDPRIFMVHLGLYGMWGEWHIGDLEEAQHPYEMTEDNKSLLANAYIDAFPNTHLLARYPENMPEPQSYGYSDGFFFGQSISSDNTFYFHNTLKDQRADLNWKNHPIGGELDPALQPTIWENWPNTVGQDVTQCLDSIRPTWIFAHHNFTNISEEGSTEWNNAIRAQREMGYTFYIDSTQFSAVGGFPSVEVNILNKGIAPMYADWDVELAVLDVNGDPSSLGFSNWNLSLIQPDVDLNYRSFTSNVSLADGGHTLLLRIVNPLENYATEDIAPFTFANTTQGADVDGWITLGDVTISGGNAGTPLVKVDGITLSHSIETILIGESLQFVATVTPVSATNKRVTWTTSKPRTVSVDHNGLVTGDEKYGAATITAYTQDGGFHAECIVTYEPTLVNIPARIEAEDDINRMGVNEGNCCDGLIDFIENISTSDWMEYGVVAPADNIFIIDYHVSSDNANGEISLVNETNDSLSFRSIENATWWEDYQIRTTDAFTLPEGEQILRVAASSGGFNLDWIEFKLVPLSYTFLGSVDDKFEDENNWIEGEVPPNGYMGIIKIEADCVVPSEYQFRLGMGGELLIVDGVSFNIN